MRLLNTDQQSNLQIKQNDDQYYRDLKQLALPISLQCLMQSSFSVIDQVMIGQLGSVSIAAIGLGGKFITLLTVMVQAVASVAGIIMAQAMGKNDAKQVRKGLYTSLLLCLLLTIFFTVIGVSIPNQIMGIYSKDSDTIVASADYLRVYAIGFIPMALNCVFSAYLRCKKQTKLPLYAGICSAIVNTALNALLIYGLFGMPKLGVEGAAWASVAAQFVGCIIVLITAFNHRNRVSVAIYTNKQQWLTFIKILLPMLTCEFLWALGENIYGYIYGHMGTKDCAAMTLINPVSSLMIGTLSGVASAAGIMIGRTLGTGDKQGAYHTSKRLLKTGILGAGTLSVILLVVSPFYPQIYNVESDVANMTFQILIAFAIICPVKVENMILGNGILRSGGKTHLVMGIDMIGTWFFGVPLGMIGAFVLHLPIALVYFILSLEECVRLVIGLHVFKKKAWMKQL